MVKPLDMFYQMDLVLDKRPDLLPIELILLYARQDMEKHPSSGLLPIPQIFRCCWYFLDHTDTDRITFLTVLLGKHSSTVFPGFGRKIADSADRGTSFISMPITPPEN